MMTSKDVKSQSECSTSASEYLSSNHNSQDDRSTTPNQDQVLSKSTYDDDDHEITAVINTDVKTTICKPDKGLKDPTIYDGSKAQQTKFANDSVDMKPGIKGKEFEQKQTDQGGSF